MSLCFGAFTFGSYLHRLSVETTSFASTETYSAEDWRPSRDDEMEMDEQWFENGLGALNRVGVEIREEILYWASPAALACLSRTSIPFAQFTNQHIRSEFQFHHVVRRFLRQDECVDLQDLLDMTGSFIWGTVVLEFFDRKWVDCTEEVDEDVDEETEDVPEEEPIDVDIFLRYRDLSRFLAWLTDTVPDFEYAYEGENAFDRSLKWIENEESRGRRAGNLLLGSLRFTRPGYKDGLNLHLTPGPPFAALLRSKSSEFHFLHSLQLFSWIIYSGHDESCGGVCSVFSLPRAHFPEGHHAADAASSTQ